MHVGTHARIASSNCASRSMDQALFLIALSIKSIHINCALSNHYMFSRITLLQSSLCESSHAHERVSKALREKRCEQRAARRLTASRALRLHKHASTYTSAVRPFSMEEAAVERDTGMKNEEGIENSGELSVDSPNAKEQEGEMNFEKKEEMETSRVNMSEQEKLDVPSLVEICKQQLIVILKDMCADSSNSDEKASFMYHLNRLRSAVTVVDLHNYIAVFGPCLSYNKLPSTWNISVCDYLKQQLNILRAADSQHTSTNYANYYDLHNEYEEAIHEKKIGVVNAENGFHMGSRNLQGSSLKGSGSNNCHGSNCIGNGCVGSGCSAGCGYPFCDQDDGLMDDYYDCLMRTKLADESPNCMKYMVNGKNDTLNSTEVDNVISYLRKYEVKSGKDSSKMEDELKYGKELDDYDFQEEYLKDKALYDSDIDDPSIVDNSSMINPNGGRNYTDSNIMNMTNTVSSGNGGSDLMMSGKDFNLKLERMKKGDILSSWSRANTEGHPEYLPRIPGVRFNPKKQQWLAAWNDNTREIRRYFSVKQYGFEQARILAVKARQEAEKAGARCKPMFHVHGRKATDGMSVDASKNGEMEDGYSGMNAGLMSGMIGGNSSGNMLLANGIGGITQGNIAPGGITPGGNNNNDPVVKKDGGKEGGKEGGKGENKGVKRGRGRPPKRKLSEDSQLSLDDMEQSLCRNNNDNGETLECMDSFDKDCTRPMKGVSYNDRKGSWLAYWSIGKNFQMRRFPIKKLGFEKAKELAIQCRLEAEQAGATTTENRTKRMKNMLTLHSENTIEGIMNNNHSMDHDDNMINEGKGINGNLLISQMHGYGGHPNQMNPHHQMNNSHHHMHLHHGNSMNGIQSSKIPHSDGQDSENDFSPTKRTRAPRGRRMESLTARASALTPVEGVRFDPYSYSWFAKYLENENSKEPKISKYLLKKWGFNKAHSLAVHTVKCAFKAVPFTDEELINIFNVDAKNLLSNQNNLINIEFKETFDPNGGGITGDSGGDSVLMNSMGMMGSINGLNGIDGVGSTVSGGYNGCLDTFCGGLNGEVGVNVGMKNGENVNMNVNVNVSGMISAFEEVEGGSGPDMMDGKGVGTGNIHVEDVMTTGNGSSKHMTNIVNGLNSVNGDQGLLNEETLLSSYQHSGEANVESGDNDMGVLSDVLKGGGGDDIPNGIPFINEGSSGVVKGIGRNIIRDNTIGHGPFCVPIPEEIGGNPDNENINEANNSEVQDKGNMGVDGRRVPSDDASCWIGRNVTADKLNTDGSGGVNIGMNSSLYGGSSAPKVFSIEREIPSQFRGIVESEENEVCKDFLEDKYDIPTNTLRNDAKNGDNHHVNHNDNSSIDVREISDNVERHALANASTLRIMNGQYNVDVHADVSTNLENGNGFTNDSTTYDQNGCNSFSSYGNDNEETDKIIGPSKKELGESSLYYMNVKPEIKTEQ
ncbi:transcription factor with AP2 domain(s), putative (ApiAP2) [Plasmodium ovale wallikeri]|uniref:Transcription factor with AP2 domain(S), putative (ApiAP2) n=1 Tax=Plasmodium ovale wallikeri TaxID=864142 RepID=A0A1A8YSL4_PLAOA|nr:transcription factor with AP2 domain(s), putative (ApiAP2) [Plasmodium ovale wallikeri]